MMEIFNRLKKKLLHLSKGLARKTLSRFSAKKHLSGNGFVKICDLYIRGNHTYSEQEISEAKHIFVKSDFTAQFLEDYGHLLAGKTVISGNGDTNFDTESPYFHFPENVYLQNLGFEPLTEKIKLLPIGLENYEHARSGFGFLHKAPKRHIFEDKILVPPMSPTNSIRERVIHDLKSANSDLFQVETKLRPVLSYLRLTRKYKFVLVCEGNGHDTHRLWEVLYQNSFPVMLNTPFSRNIRNLGYPVLVVDSILEISASLLKSHLLNYELIFPKKIERLWMPYWKKEILGPRMKTN
jgi:hypothetical protein